MHFAAPQVFRQKDENSLVLKLSFSPEDAAEQPNASLLISYNLAAWFLFLMFNMRQERGSQPFLETSASFFSSSYFGIRIRRPARRQRLIMTFHFHQCHCHHYIPASQI